MALKFSFHLKKLTAAVCAALALSAPVVASAHFLSSAQEKQIGNQAVADFKKAYNTYESSVLTHIQQRLLEWNPDKLWRYGSAGHKRGLEPILCADKDEVNAVCYGGGQVIVYEPMLDFLASDEPGHYYKLDRSHVRPYRQSDLYQMASLAAVVGHEFGHWENEDSLRMHDKEMYTRIIAAAIPVGNVWAMLGVAAGQSLANAFNSRQMGFRTEQQADEKAMEYSEMVPEFSIGGEAIYQRRAVISKINNGTIDKVNWLHPHSKSGKRFERALTGMEKSSRGYFVWEGYSLSVFGRKYSNEKVVGMYHHPQVVDRFERYLYVLGQVATAIKYDFARTRNFELRPENEVFPDGSASNTVLLLRGRGTDRKDHVKVVDTYRGVSMREAQRILDMDYGKMLDDMHNKILAGEFWNLAEARWFVQEYETRLAQYGPRGSNAEKYDAPEEREEDPRN